MWPKRKQGKVPNDEVVPAASLGHKRRIGDPQTHAADIVSHFFTLHRSFRFFEPAIHSFTVASVKGAQKTFFSNQCLPPNLAIGIGLPKKIHFGFGPNVRFDLIVYIDDDEDYFWDTFRMGRQHGRRDFSEAASHLESSGVGSGPCLFFSN